MEGFFIFIAIFLVSGVLFGLQKNAVTSPGRVLARKFAALGTIAGKSQQEITSAVGPPSSFSALPEGKTLLQWQATGYHIALRFTGDICDGVTHEHLSQN